MADPEILPSEAELLHVTRMTMLGLQGAVTELGEMSEAMTVGEALFVLRQKLAGVERVFNDLQKKALVSPRQDAFDRLTRKIEADSYAAFCEEVARIIAANDEFGTMDLLEELQRRRDAARELANA
jgi:GH24 family phage-related lysozyme (muramidase)